MIWVNSEEPGDEYPLYSDRLIPAKKEGTVRIWVDGCFDMLHYGHSNLLCRARALGHELFVGVHDDAEILKHKGIPIMHTIERYEALKANTFVDYVIENYPYATRIKDMRRFEIDYVVHGDDVTYDASGVHSYQEIVDAGLFRTVKRTMGISTTEIIERMLLCNKQCTTEVERASNTTPVLCHTAELIDSKWQSDIYHPNLVPGEHSDRELLSLTVHQLTCSDNRVIVYVPGVYDLFHAGHSHYLRAILQEHSKKYQQGLQQCGLFNSNATITYNDVYLIAGIYSDEVSSRIYGSNQPILSLKERVLSAVTCKFISEIFCAPPVTVTVDFINKYRIDFIYSMDSPALVGAGIPESKQPFQAPLAMHIMKGLPDPVHTDRLEVTKLTTGHIVNRVVEEQSAYIERQEKKAKL